MILTSGEIELSIDLTPLTNYIASYINSDLCMFISEDITYNKLF